MFEGTDVWLSGRYSKAEPARRTVRRVCYYILKWLGVFRLASLLTRRSLHILCYHGFALEDEARFRPRLFINPATFERRMKFLAEKNYAVLPLSLALECLANGNLPVRPVVLTIDDGFAGVYERAMPILQQFTYPATTYVTTYYVANGNPVFRLVVQYMFWKTEQTELATDGLGLPLKPRAALSTEGEKERVMSAVIRLGETQRDESGRQKLARTLGKQLGVDYDTLIQKRILSLMTPEEVRSAAAAGMDIQLHTHRHRLPLERELVLREIEDNRAVLEPLVGKQLEHLCYPSGYWVKEQWPWLEETNVISATTCQPGLNHPRTPLLGLRRFLDGEHVAPIEFEAEMCGLAELLRAARGLVYRAFLARNHQSAGAAMPSPD